MPSSSSTTRSMLRKQSPTSTGLRWVVAASESAGAKRAAEVVTQVVAVVLPGAKTASIVASLVTCLASVRSPRNLEVAAGVAETASTVTSLVIRPESARSQRNPESLVVAVALAVAETASTAASPDTCPGSARNPRSLERPRDLEADQVDATESVPEE